MAGRGAANEVGHYGSGNDADDEVSYFVAYFIFSQSLRAFSSIYVNVR
jgi:hypothetical protein